MTISTIMNFFYSGRSHMLIGLPVSSQTISQHFQSYGNGVYEMSGFIHFEGEFITVTNGVVSHVFNGNV